MIVSYEIIYAEEDQMKKVAGTAFIGDGRGGLLDNLQQFVSLEERGSTAIAEESTQTVPSGKESKVAAQTKTAKDKPMDEGNYD